jgi:hypothetical protein
LSSNDLLCSEKLKVRVKGRGIAKDDARAANHFAQAARANIWRAGNEYALHKKDSDF